MSEADGATVVLPTGVRLDGWAREAVLRPLCGFDEELLLESDALGAAARVTTLLGRCLVRLGDREAPGPEVARSLVVGDREALLLELRRLTFGERMSCLVNCPAEGCGEKLDLDLDVGDLRVPAGTDETDWFERMVAVDGDDLLVRFRLPTGGDQEAVAATALDDPVRAAEELVERCVAMPRPTSTAVAAVVGTLMADLDPQAEIGLDLCCPACGCAFTAPFDTADYLFREVAAREADLFTDVHLLALHYHWSEAEILGLTMRRRRRYLERLAETFPERVE